MCPEQEVCPSYNAGHKRKPHHVRITELCVNYKDGKCGAQGEACDLFKMRNIREKFGFE